MSHPVVLDKSLVNPEIVDNFYDFLVFPLETAKTVEDFCRACLEVIIQRVAVRVFIVFRVEEGDNIVREYEFYPGEKPNIVSIYSTLKQEIPANQNYEQSLCWVKGGGVYLFPLIFKNQLLGYVYLETEKGEKVGSYSLKFLSGIFKFISLYLYQDRLEKKEKQLEEREKTLESNLRKQSEYLSYMNHELRTPLAAVIGFSKMLQQRIYGDLNPKQAQYVDAIYQSATYLLELISDLLDLSKIEAKKEELFLEKILVRELCEASLSLVKTKAEEQNLELKLEIDEDIVYCEGDQRRLKQILVNLLSNAVKFTEEGSVTLRVTREGDWLLFKVIDTGIGIDEESQKKLFQPFVQLKTPLHKKHRGSGLGLVISRGLARLHGGDITLISEEGKGSCFTVWLPLNPQENSQKQEKQDNDY
ncbi:MAG: HAMP domain-containing histidine kinase [Geminocystis sp.]|nr:HAMP domain-containing histidine kinase [Geminocystis sp.]HIK38409.1 HAMP domain-containing histidine kinase [Geminocystis sp. M7585_C2015_104]MCS7147754.1 HAMP domain-containing histidine kinase [Geminocystis sp.]MCX8079226.1 HAMP domain-containing histidine kinase [Geminocystis sp.]MDW8116672.1 HAMP domain-containing sensor histidine kinase [Geminocystis sp.]